MQSSEDHLARKKISNWSCGSLGLQDPLGCGDKLRSTGDLACSWENASCYIVEEEPLLCKGLQRCVLGVIACDVSACFSGEGAQSHEHMNIHHKGDLLTWFIQYGLGSPAIARTVTAQSLKPETSTVSI